MNALSHPLVDRPHMPESYGLSKNTTDRLNWEWVQNRLITSRNYWVATTRANGRPHVVPVWGIWKDECFYFGTDIQSVKGRNLIRNPYLIVHLESGDEAVILECRAERVDDPVVLKGVLSTYAEKYGVFSDENELSSETIFFAAKPYKAFAWRESDFPASATRWRIDR
ncbi:MAG TPA: pyridoxamine 5'-phosphate oxidase [Anaerolineaceae bacterium]|nr:pyridoxamine 5'-phosphate oxidase [Anaerolineaceae bacterium]